MLAQTCIFFCKNIVFLSNSSDVCSKWSHWQLNSIGLDNGLAPNRRHANIWTSDDLAYWRTYASLGIEFIENRQKYRLQFHHVNVYVIHFHHDDAIKWKHFPRYRPFVRVFTGHRWIPRTKASDAFSNDLRLIKRLSKQSWGWWYQTPSRSLWRHCNNSCLPVSSSLTVWMSGHPSSTGMFQCN